MRNPFRRKALTASPEFISALHDRQVSTVARLGGSNYAIVQAVAAAMSWGLWDIYKSSPALRTVVDLIANNVAQLDLRLYDEVDVDEREAQPDHPAMASLRFPHPNMTGDQFVRYAVKSFLLYENFFATKHRGTQGGPIQFVVIPPERVEVSGRGLVPEWYGIYNNDGTISDAIPAQDMLHWRGENFNDMRIGCSKLDTLRAVVIEENAMGKAIVELAKSGLAEPQWIFRPLEAPEWSNEARKRMEQDAANRLKQAGAIPPVMEEGMELRGFGVSPKDAEMLAVRKYALQQVASLYNVPLGMVGLDPNVEQARSEFYSDTLPTICEAFCRQLNLQVLYQEFSEDSLYYEFDLDEKLMGDERLRSLTGAAGVPPLLRNEARAKLNLPPVEGGDEPITPLNVIAGNPSKPSVNVNPIPAPGAPTGEEGPGQDGEPATEAVAAVLQRFYERIASGKKAPSRYRQELEADLGKTGLNGDASLAAAAITRGLEEALRLANRAEVFNRAKAEAPQTAAMWTMSLDELRTLGVPEEMLWERAGLSSEQIDRMLTLRYEDDFARSGREPSNH